MPIAPSADDGEVATYIPELAQAAPDSFGLALATTDGALYEVGDSRVPFTIQSISKPLTYGLALERWGAGGRRAHRCRAERRCVQLDRSRARHGNAQEPDDQRRRDLAASACSPPTPSGRSRTMLAVYGRYAGREAHRRRRRLPLRAADRPPEPRDRHHLLRTFDVIEGDPERGLDFYFRQCAITVEARDLALIGATLANGGIHPLTGERAVDGGVLRDVLSVMTTCGMYDGAGRWLTGIGCPRRAASPRRDHGCPSRPAGDRDLLAAARRAGQLCPGRGRVPRPLVSAPACTSSGPESGRPRRSAPRSPSRSSRPSGGGRSSTGSSSNRSRYAP